MNVSSKSIYSYIAAVKPWDVSEKGALTLYHSSTKAKMVKYTMRNGIAKFPCQELNRTGLAGLTMLGKCQGEEKPNSTVWLK